eukprot:TRINITY_DN4189_c0_g1_i1.p2 TRINITY_DN4189_c0_g1~~TRINITY_DN4189_c0_g1_i1.p2  ORF type:complete len:118 (-),score=22.54 TRINITY_DN4189_c0_g1_i1:2-355(-)
MIRRPPRSTHCISSAASDVYKRQIDYNSKTTRAPDFHVELFPLHSPLPVSYTHLTLPTICSVQISVVAVSLKKKKKKNAKRAVSIQTKRYDNEISTEMVTKTYIGEIDNCQRCKVDI